MGILHMYRLLHCFAFISIILIKRIKKHSIFSIYLFRLKIRIYCECKHPKRKDSNYKKKSILSSSTKSKDISSSPTEEYYPRNASSTSGNGSVINFTESKPKLIEYSVTNISGNMQGSKEPSTSKLDYLTVATTFKTMDHSLNYQTKWNSPSFSEKAKINFVTTDIPKMIKTIYNTAFFSEHILTNSMTLVTTDLPLTEKNLLLENNTNDNSSAKTMHRLKKAKVGDYWILIIVCILVVLTLLLSITSFAWFLRLK